MASRNGMTSLDGCAGKAAQGVVRQLELVALAEQDADGTVALARRRRRRREAALQQRDGGVQLVVALERRRDVLARDAELAQPALYPLAAPGVQAPAVVRGALRETRVV